MEILAVSPFYTYPADNGGKTRIFKLYEYLSKKHKVFQYSCNFFRYVGRLQLYSFTSYINKNFTEYVHSPPHYSMFSLIAHGLNIPPLVYANELMATSTSSILYRKMQACDFIQVEEPFQFDYIYKKNKGRKKIVADSQNVEYVLAKSPNYFLTKSRRREKVLKKLFGMEKRYVTMSDIIFCASEKDRQEFMEFYGADKDKLKVLPNGVDLREFPLVTDKLREQSKAAMGLKGKKVVFFVGGTHHPNQEALSMIKQLAAKVKDPDVLFLIAGAIGDGEHATHNMRFTGGGTHDEMLKYFKVADVALNNITSGSGTNVKLLQYLAAGLPTISTRFGTRGLEITDRRGIMLAETAEEYIESIQKILSSQKIKKILSSHARNLVKGKYDFETISKKAERYYKEMLDGS
ncbi:glycosyltransferase family 4 protein [Candidatus Woesearchaeota archaeon]|nr:glycosyltransferase family 4 protein [Candidatus Woesearchaeota archaeon]